MSIHLEKEIANLKKKLLQEGTLVEEILENAIHAYNNMDVDKAHGVIESDKKIDALEVEIEEDCLKVLALHRPVAIELRFIVTVLRINNDLERIGDLAGNLASRVIKISFKDEAREQIIDFSDMFSKAKFMLKQSIDALVNQDIDLAKKVVAMDDEIDALRYNLRNELKIQFKNRPEKTSVLLHNLSIIYYLERIGDLSTNIAEDVIYMIQGRIVRHANKMIV